LFVHSNTVKTVVKLWFTRPNLAYVFNFKCKCVCMQCSERIVTKQPNLKLKTLLQQPVGSLPVACTLATMKQAVAHSCSYTVILSRAWSSFGLQDKTWPELSTLDGSMCVCRTVNAWQQNNLT